MQKKNPQLAVTSQGFLLWLKRQNKEDNSEQKYVPSLLTIIEAVPVAASVV